jgi:hypothetical protein
MPAIPASQNTAPVNEFRCLFTPDIRKKQKKWQDGFLKFHTFNSRVMVYDTARNYIGETFWKESNALQEGDELNLDKPIMVQVEDPIGTTHTDLTPLLAEKKTKESPQGKVASRQLSRPPTPASTLNVARTGSQLRHKSLNALLGTPKGPIGKAVTMRSPYETRIEKENEWAAARNAKRQKTTHSSVDLTSSSPVRDGDTPANKDLPLWARTSNATKATAPPGLVPKAVAPASLESDYGHTLSDITMPSTPTAIERPKPRPTLTSMPAPKSGPRIQEQPQAHVTPKPIHAKIRLPKPIETPRPPPPPSSPPVSASNRASGVDFAVQPTVQPAKKPLKMATEQLSVEPSIQPSKQPIKQPSPPVSLERVPKAKSLRLFTGTRRGMLMCQAAPQQRARIPNEAPKAVPKPRRQKEASIPVSVLSSSSVDSIIRLSDDDEPRVQSVSKSSKPSSGIMKEKRKTPPVAEKVIVPKKRKPREPSPQSSPDAFEDMETIQGLMDAQLLVHTSPPKPDRITKSKSSPLSEAVSAPIPKLKKVKAIAPKKASLQQTRTREPSPAPAPAPKVTKQKPAAKRRTGEKETTRSISPAVIASELPSLEPQRTPSLSLSPSKTALLSTGGFRKKPKPPKVTSITSATTAPTNPQPAPRQISVPLPPHPLRANKAGPLMSTTELSALLQNPPKKRRPKDDSTDAGMQDGASAKKRGFKRVRSENDVEGPIPSTSEMWEAQNLPSGEKADGTSSEAKPSAGAGPVAKLAKKPSGLAALCGKTDPRKRLARTASLNLDTDVSTVGLPEGLGSVSPLEQVDTDKGPWSTEAFDLFDWRPPVKEGEKVKDKGIGMLVDA